MTLGHIYGHEHLLGRLEGVLASGRFPQAALLAGPAGVGKQRIALWVAAALLCEGSRGGPCGACGSCRRCEALTHPDLHWIVPIPRLKATDPEKRLEEARLAIAETVASRAEGHYRRPDGLASHSLASVRWLLRVAGMTPFSGARKVIVIGDAERLVVQESTPDAANALLKVLEEPPPDTTLILTAAEPQSLLPTVRSRLVTIRVPPVSDEAVRAFLREEGEARDAPGDLESLVLRAEGCIGRVVWAGESGPRADADAASLLAAIRTGGAAWSARALVQPPWSARGDFTAMLDALAVAMRGEIAGFADTGDLSGMRRRLAAVRRIEAARTDASGNINPQLTLAALAQELEALV